MHQLLPFAWGWPFIFALSFSYGIVLWELLTREIPFGDMPIVQVGIMHLCCCHAVDPRTNARVLEGINSISLNMLRLLTAFLMPQLWRGIGGMLGGVGCRRMQRTPTYPSDIPRWLPKYRQGVLEI